MIILVKKKFSRDIQILILPFKNRFSNLCLKVFPLISTHLFLKGTAMQIWSFCGVCTHLLALIKKVLFHFQLEFTNENCFERNEFSVSESFQIQRRLLAYVLQNRFS